jgi:CheY-like chemotaxis protein
MRRMLTVQAESEAEMTLLIVEDNHDMRRLLRGLLKDIAETIYECTDGSEAVAAYEAHRPDWVLMDIKMKEVDGIAATRRIKARWPAAQIMIVTDYDDATFRQAAHDAGACEYVVKDSLVEVRRLLINSAQGKS